MDAMARGLRNAAKLVQDGLLDGMRKQRYSSWSDSQLGRYGSQPLFAAPHPASPCSTAAHHAKRGSCRLAAGLHNCCLTH